MINRRLSTDLDAGALLAREWLVANGLGGYAMGSLLGPPTRRYHGPLVAALPAPLGRVVILDGLSAFVEGRDGRLIALDGGDFESGLRPPDVPPGFALEQGLPVWTYRLGDVLLEKRLIMSHLQNTTHVLYRLLEGAQPIRLRLVPWVAFRPHGHPVGEPVGPPPGVTPGEGDGLYEMAGPAGMPVLRWVVRGRRATFVAGACREDRVRYRVEEERGDPFLGSRRSPGWFQVDLDVGDPAALTASVEPWSAVLALSVEESFEAERTRRERLVDAAEEPARSGVAAELVLAADSFVILPLSRVSEAARAHAHGDEVRSVIAGYPWFTDWGRDTMISLEGLALVPGRHRAAGDILLTFGRHVRDGLIPNLFPEGSEQGLYHTADASLWFFHAVDRYLAATSDRGTFDALFPALIDIVEHHLAGTHFGIGVDHDDGLLRQGAECYQLTWMDAKVEGWVVTPRRGKAVEINALWYNALRLLEAWFRERDLGGEADQIGSLASAVHRSFNRRFWNPSERQLYDVVDGDRGDDPACRPNQIFAISLRYPVLDPVRWKDVLETVSRRLLTPFGLRSLAPGDPDYKPRYFGDLRARDAAYHQGTVWTWLIGPYLDAYRRCYPDDAETPRRILDGLLPHLDDAGIGTISEIFDADPPYLPRGCIAQAWSVAEVLRCLTRSFSSPSRPEPPETSPGPGRRSTSPGPPVP